MQIEQTEWTAPAGWQPQAPGRLSSAHLVFIFGSTSLIKDRQKIASVRAAYPSAHFIGCSTAGEICGTTVKDDSLVLSAIQFDHTRLRAAHLPLLSPDKSYEVGQNLAEMLYAPDLAHVFVISEGLNVNGTELVEGMTSELPDHITVTGGLSGDGARLSETYVVTDEGVRQQVVSAIGFYGDRIRISYGSLGGWDSFGPERLVTRSKANILYELDGKSALDLYKKYLGEHAEGLPATALLFPLSLRIHNEQTSVVRTILGVNEEEQSMTFAGDIPQGAYARLMKANFDRLIDGAAGAATTSYEALGSSAPELAVLISCVGRKLVLGQRIEEEVEAVREVLGDTAVLTGFYSYGEISPFTPNAKCELHNQTMTITTFTER